MKKREAEEKKTKKKKMKKKGLSSSLRLNGAGDRSATAVTLVAISEIHIPLRLR